MIPSSLLLIPWLLVSLGSLLLYAGWQFYLRVQSRKTFMRQHNCHRSGPSYPGFRPIFGLDFLLKNVYDVARYKFATGHAERHDLYGPTYWSRILLKEVIYTVEAENLEAVFKTHAEDYRLMDARHVLMETFYGNGIIGNSGAAWKRSRSLVHPAVTTMTQSLDPQVFEEHAANLVNQIRAKQGGFDLAELTSKYSLDISSFYFFGESTYSLTPQDKRLEEFAKDFTVVGKMSRKLTIFNRMFPFLRHIMFWHDYHTTTKGVREFVDSYIDEATSGYVKSNNTIVRSLAAQTTDKEEIRGEVLNILLAARDTVGMVLSELFYMLARNPGVWEKLRTEALSLSESPSFAEINKLTYLRHCLAEASRLRSTFSVHGRIAVRDTVLPKGGGDGNEPLLVPGGSYVVYCIYKLHRNPAVFGEDIEVFRPERWEEISPSTFEYLPFSAGPRACPGKQMATLMIAYATVKLAREFEHLKPMDDRSWREARAFSFYNQNGIHIAME